jgi:Oxygenase domain of the 2OGFeDO superfamily
MAVKVIVADKKIDCKHLIGQFVDENHYDHLIEEDTDVYMPAPYGEDPINEDRIVLKFRKNFFTKEQQDQAYAGLREAATETQNRGAAAGPRGEKLGNREWVTEYESEMVEYFLDPYSGLAGDPVEDIIKRYKGKPPTPSNRNNVWSIERTKSTNFNFDQWVEKVRALPRQEQIKEANFVADELICATTYANSVYSGIAGWFDRYPRIPYGRATSYTAKNPEKFALAYPFLQTLSNGFRDLLPQRYEAQMKAARQVDPRFLVPGTPFTTVTVNKTFRTAAHTDVGDLNSGLSNLLTLSNDGRYSGGYLIAPEYRVAVNPRPGDLLLINNHDVMHGNTPIVCEEGSERISLVCYFREKMLELGSWEYENCRYEFVESRRKNPEHPLQRKLWNGVSEGMWTSDEWYEYCRDKLGEQELLKYHPEAQKSGSLDEFFA